MSILDRIRELANSDEFSGSSVLDVPTTPDEVAQAPAESQFISPESFLGTEEVKVPTVAEEVIETSPEVTKGVEDTSDAVAEELAAVSDAAVEEVAAKSSPVIANIFDEDDNFIESKRVVDGDGTSGRRFSFNANVLEDRGKSFDAYETFKPDAWFEHPKFGAGRRKKLAKQRRSLARLLGYSDVSKVTNADVFFFGARSKAKAERLIKSADGLNKLKVEGPTFKSSLEGDKRVLGQAILNEQGQDIRVLMNTPEDNANFFSKYNARGAAEYDLGSTRVAKGKELSDFDTANTLKGAVLNKVDIATSGITNLFSGFVNAGSNVVGDVVGEIVAGESDVTSVDTTINRQNQLIKEQATKEAELEFDKRSTPETRRLAAEVLTDQAIANYTGADFNKEQAVSDVVDERGVGTTSTEEPAETKESFVARRTNELFRERASKEQLDFEDGTGVGTKTTDNKLISTSTGEFDVFPTKRKLVTTTVKTVDDRKKTLDAKRSTREFISNAAVSIGSLGMQDPLFKADDAPKITDRDGGLNLDTSPNTILSRLATEDEDVVRAQEEADALWGEGKYVQAAAKWVKGAGTKLIKHPEAAFEGVLASAPEMAAMVTIPGLALVGNIHRNYEEGKNDFFEKRNSFPNKSQQKILLATSIATGLLEKAGAEALAGSVGKKASNALVELLKDKLGFSVAQTMSIAASATVEGVEELMVGMLGQYGKNQGQEKIFDSKELYQQFTDGFGIGAQIKGGISTPSLVRGVGKDLKAVGKKIIKTKPDTPEQTAAKADKVVANVAASNDKSVDSTLAPNVVVGADHDFAAQVADSVDVPIEEDVVPTGLGGFPTEDGERGESATLVEKTTTKPTATAQLQDDISRKEGILAQIQIDKKTAKPGKELQALEAREKRIGVFLEADRKALNDSSRDTTPAEDSQGPAAPVVDEAGQPVPEVNPVEASSESIAPTVEEQDASALEEGTPLVSPEATDTTEAAPAEVEETPEVQVGKAISALVEANEGDLTSAEGLSALNNANLDAARALENEAQALQANPATFTPERAQALNDLMVVQAQSRGLADDAREARKDTPIDNINSPAGIGELLTRGSAPSENIDLTPIEGDLQDIITDLADLDENLATEANVPRSADEVGSEVLGTRVNTKGKAGLGRHLANLGAAVAGNNIANAAQQLQNIIDFKRLQVAKLKAFEKGLKTFKAQKGTKEPVTVTFGKTGQFVISEALLSGAEKTRSRIKREIAIIEKGIGIGLDLNEAAFSPARFRARKAAEGQAAKTAASKAHQAAVARPATLETVLTPTPFTPPTQPVAEGAVDDTSVASEVDGASEATSTNSNIPTKEALIAEGTAARAKVVRLDKEIALLSQDPNAVGLEEKQDLRERTAQRIRELRSILSRKIYAQTKAGVSAPVAEPSTLVFDSEKGTTTFVNNVQSKNKYVQSIARGIARIRDIENKYGYAYDDISIDELILIGNTQEGITRLVNKLPAKYAEGVAAFNKSAELSPEDVTQAALDLINYVDSVTDTKTSELFPVPAVVKAEPEVDPAITPTIENSPEVPARPTVDTPSKLEEEALEVKPQSKAERDAIIDAEIAGSTVVREKSEEVKPVKRSALFNELINFAKEVINVRSKVTKEGPAKETASTKALKALGTMLVPRKADGDISGIIGRVADLFAAVRGISDARFNSEARVAAQMIETFAIEFKAAITQILPDVEIGANGVQVATSPQLKGKSIIPWQVLNRSPGFSFINEFGELKLQVQDAMAIAILEWYQTDAGSTRHQTPEDIYRFAGLEIDSGVIAASDIEYLSDKGVPRKGHALRVGRDIMVKLNIKQNPEDAALDPGYETRMAQSLGDMAFVAMAAMKDSHTDVNKQEARGYITFEAIPAVELTEMFGKDIEGELADTKADALVNFVRVPEHTSSQGNLLLNPSNSRPVASKSVRQLTALTQSTGFKVVMDAIQGSSRHSRGVTAIPRSRIPEFMTDTSSRLSKLLQSFITKLNSQKLQKNPQWKLMQAFRAENRVDWLKMHGWVQPDIDPITGEATFPRMHDEQAISAQGKNQTLEREFDQMQEHENEYAAGLAQVQEEITFLNAEAEALERASAKTKPSKEETQRFNAIGKLLAGLAVELKAYESGDIYLEHHIISNGRANDKTSTLSVQRSKMHRNALSLVSSVEAIDRTNKKHIRGVIFGLIEPLGLKKSVARKDPMEALSSIMDSNGNFSNPVIAKGIAAINASQSPEGTFKHSDITDAVLAIDNGAEGPHTLGALITLAAWSSAIIAEESGFVSYGYTEVDGTTNGVIASLRQFVGGFSVDGLINRPKGSPMQRIVDLFNSGGMIFKGQRYAQGPDYLENNPDAYQSLGELASAKIAAVKQLILNSNSNTLKDEQAAARTALNAINKVNKAQRARNVVVDLAEAIAAEAVKDAAETAFGVDVFLTTMPDFAVSDETDRVSPAIRKLMKSVVMPGNYQAGDRALSNSLFNAWLTDIYKQIAIGANQREDSSTGPYQEDFVGINTTLEKAGINYRVTAANAKRSFSRDDVKILKGIYEDSLGKSITDAYRDSMGEFTTNMKTINSIFGVQGVVQAAIMEHHFTALAGDNGFILSRDQQMAERRRVQAEHGDFVGWKSFGAADASDSHSIVKEEKRVIADKDSNERGGHVFTPFRKGVVNTTVHRRDKKGQRTSTIEPTSSVTSRIDEWVPSADIGTAGGVGMTIHMDGAVQASSSQESGVETINLFDANLGGSLAAKARAVFTNKAFEKVTQGFSGWDGALDQMLHLNERAEEILTKEEYDVMQENLAKFFNPAVQDAKGRDDGTGNRHAPSFVNAEGITVLFTSMQQFVTHAEQQRTIGNQQREAVSGALRESDNHSGDDTAHSLAQEDGSFGDTTHGSSGSSLDLVSFEGVLKTSATEDRVSNLFKRYIGRNNIKDSPEHIRRLSNLMINHILPLVRDSTGYTVSVDTGPGITGGLNQGLGVYIRTSDKAERLFGTDMSDAEVLTHEFLHPIVEAGFKDNIKAVKEARFLQQLAIRDPEFTPKSLVDPKDTNRAEAEKKAEALYDYVMGDIQEFMTFGLSNAVILAALEKVAVPTKTPGRVKSIVNKLLDILSSMIELLTGKVIGRTSAPTNVASSLDALINSFDTTTRVHMARRVASVIDNRVVSGGRSLIADNITKPIKAWARTASFATPVGKVLETGKNPTKLESVTAILKSPFQVTEGPYQAAIADSIRSVIDHKTDFLSKTAREILGEKTDITKEFHETGNMVNQHVDNAALTYSDQVKIKITNAFKRTLVNSEQKMLADTLLRGDLKVFKDMIFEDLATLLTDTGTNTTPSVLDAQIRDTIAKLKSTDKVWINNQAKNLGTVLAGFKPQIENGNLNAHNIAIGVKHPRRNRFAAPTNKSDKAVIDELKSLYAIKNMSVDSRNQLAKMIREEPVGIKVMLEIDAVNHAATLKHTYNNDESRVIAGEVISKSTNRSRVVLKTSRKHAEHVAAGWELQSAYGTTLGLYSRPNTPGEAYQKGVVSLGNADLEGVMVKPEDRAEGEIYLPVVAGGNVIGYRAVLDKQTRESEAGMSIGAAESLGNHGARTIRLTEGGSFNNKVISMIRADFLKNRGNPREWERISINNLDSKQAREFAALIPREARKKIREEWGGDMFIRKNQLDLLIGYRKLSLVDSINDGLRASGRGEMNRAFSDSVRLAGDVWQGVVAEVKKRTVIFNPEVVLANFTSNLAVSVIYGMNPVDIYRDQKEGLTAIRTYTAWQREAVALDIAISIGENVAANTRERARVQKLMEASGVHSMVQAGMFQTIVEDIDISANGGGSPLGAALRQALPTAANEAIETLWQNTPDVVRKSTGVVMLTPTTEFGKNVQAATAQSDFIARYAMIKHLRKQGVSESEAMAQAREIFVDYTPNTSREMQYINDSGLYMYTKFLFRIQRVVMRAFRENPEGVIAFEVAQQLLGGIPDVGDSSFMWGVSLGGGRTLMPGEAGETLFQFPLFYMFRGLKDVFGFD